MILSNSQKINNDRFTSKMEKKIKLEQRKLSQKIDQLHEKIGDSLVDKKRCCE